MTTAITLDDLGEGHDEATFVDWLAEEGTRVDQGEPIAEVMTDKVSTEIVSPATGVLRDLRAEPDDTLMAGAIIGMIEVAP